MFSTSTHVYSEIYIHLNWHTKESRPFITPQAKPALYDYLENYCNKTKGIEFLGLGGIANHIHLAIQIEPFICLADWIGQIKGSSSHEIKTLANLTTFEWQRGYGALSFARRDLKNILAYLATQEHHHQQGTCNPTMENFGQYMETVQEEDEAYGSSLL
jgi:putative transposase